MEIERLGAEPIDRPTEGEPLRTGAVVTERLEEELPLENVPLGREGLLLPWLKFPTLAPGVSRVLLSRTVVVLLRVPCWIDLVVSF